MTVRTWTGKTTITDMALLIEGLKELGVTVSEVDSSLMHDPVTGDGQVDTTIAQATIDTAIANVVADTVTPMSAALDEDYSVQESDFAGHIVFDPQSINRDATLPVLTGDQAGWWVDIINSSTAGLYDVKVQGMTTVATISSEEEGHFVWDGTVWFYSVYTGNTAAPI